MQFAPAGGRECVSERPLCGAQRSEVDHLFHAVLDMSL